MGLGSFFNQLKQFFVSSPLVPKTIQPKRAKKLTMLTKAQQQNYVAIDCEMVGVGPNGSVSALARVSIVDFHGNVLLDEYVKPTQPVTQYRTWVSGIRPKHLRNARGFKAVTKIVSRLIDKKILVGHAIHHDLQALAMKHPPDLIRDTSTYQPLLTLAKTDRPSLKKLAKLILDLQIQQKSHCSIDDAKATMAIYRTQQEEWEDELLKSKKQQAELLSPEKHDILPKQPS
ncbi:hypothetical protein PTTG_04709 [Puccinia triticina 1-1 BBBD Race 1]|uniref:RNA exonuclease 4 n=2 Tax=Puccinia triticina TaxID=208348 RepID=A0A180G2L7_PUCT1|nr:uncharacterized protein PtA15_1A391 [Puccinia triticina]OAV86828.1 hypothetical protein PTTG_04709 [Puccinia triticina 1-1 BBBD Race 1]WAQ81053.1 hypothetical protein PtA15_1A391 [Puccinia triticina]WAR51946.1 hypothetical protein PtB15_1B383 [Puccinia triticina]